MTKTETKSRFSKKVIFEWGDLEVWANTIYYIFHWCCCQGQGEGNGKGKGEGKGEGQGEGEGKGEGLGVRVRVRGQGEGEGSGWGWGVKVRVRVRIRVSVRLTSDAHFPQCFERRDQLSRFLSLQLVKFVKYNNRSFQKHRSNWADSCAYLTAKRMTYHKKRNRIAIIITTDAFFRLRWMSAFPPLECSVSCDNDCNNNCNPV